MSEPTQDEQDVPSPASPSAQEGNTTRGPAPGEGPGHLAGSGLGDRSSRADPTLESVPPGRPGIDPASAYADEPTLTGEPTVQVPSPSAVMPPPAPPPHWQVAAWPPPPGQQTFGDPPPPPGFYAEGGPPYPGAPGSLGSNHGGVPPYGSGPGHWGQPPGPPSPPWQWAPAPPHRPPTRPGASLLTALLTVAVALAAVLGVLIGHAVWRSASNSSPGTGSPFGGGIGAPSPSNPGPGQGPAGSGGPANAASIAQSVDPGVVDINTSVSYQGLQGAGTGMVLTPGGEVLTNNHVIEGATKISVTDVGNHKTYTATVVGYDRSQDVAVLQLNGASGLQTVSIGDSAKVSPGQGVVAVGNANGSGGTPSYAGGSVTATNQSITASDQVAGTSERLSGLIQTNADIVSGDSGGPLVNASGQVVGIDTAGSGGFQFQEQGNQGYAIPINSATTTAKRIEAGSGSPTIHIGPTAFLGVEVRPAGSGAGGSGGSGGSGGFGGFGGIGGNNGGGNGANPSTPGAAIVDVVSGGPADQAGLQQGDTITSLDGHAVTSPDSLTTAMLGEKPGTSAQVQYVDSSGQQHSTTVTLGSGPPQ